MRIFKYRFSFLVLLMLLLACNDQQEDFNLLPSKKVNFQVNYNLNRATIGFAGGHKVFKNQGLRGIVLINTDGTKFKAYDLACPHLRFEKCDKGLTTDDYPFLKCPCDDKAVDYHVDVPYKTIGKTTYYLRSYRVIFDGSTIHITNY